MDKSNHRGSNKNVKRTKNPSEKIFCKNVAKNNQHDYHGAGKIHEQEDDKKQSNPPTLLSFYINKS
jgi:hypothetical protein